MAKKKNAPAPTPVENSAPASAGADNKENGTEKKAPPRYYSFKYVAQCDFSNQMAVHNWLINDPHFRVVWIQHDKDTYSEHDIEEHPDQWKNGIYTRKNGDGSESQFRVGDTKPTHIHGYVRLQTKVTVKTMAERFGNYLTFLAVTDSYASLIYFTHSDFKSQILYHKHLYSESELRGDIDLYRDNCKKISTTDNFGALMAVYCDYVKRTGTHTRAVQALLRDGRTDVLADIRKNASFYNNFVAKTGREIDLDIIGSQDPNYICDEKRKGQEPQEVQEPQEPQEPQEVQEIQHSIGIYGTFDARSKAPLYRCVMCGKAVHAASASHFWQEGKELLCICGLHSANFGKQR